MGSQRVGHDWATFTFIYGCFFSPSQDKFMALTTHLLSLSYRKRFSCVWILDLLLLLFIVQSLSHVQLFATLWTAAHQISLSFTVSQSLLKFMFIESVMLSKYLILCFPFLLLPSIFPSIRVFSLHQVAKVLKLQLQHHFFQWIFRVDFL